MCINSAMMRRSSSCSGVTSIAGKSGLLGTSRTSSVERENSKLRDELPAREVVDTLLEASRVARPPPMRFDELG